MLGPFYIAASPRSTIIGPEDLLQDPTNHLKVSGNVLSSQDCTKGLSGITIEIWYAGEEGYRDDEYRGMLVTEECGKYNYTQTYPALYTGRPLHVHVRASRGDEELLVTQMYFVGEEFGYQPSRTLQAVEITEADDGSRAVRFDIYLDVPGDDGEEDCSQLSTVSSSSPVASSPVASPVVNEQEEESPVASPIASNPQPTTDTESPVVAPVQSPSVEFLPSTSVVEPTETSFANNAVAHFGIGVSSLVLLLTTL
jgi:protocatechuate 3,4-dioxygenase beta subunit